MRDLFSSLAQHIAALPQDGFNALMDARPDAAELLFGGLRDGQPAEADVRSIVDALSVPDGIADAVVRLTRPEVQVLMALRDAAEDVGDWAGAAFGDGRFAGVARAGGHLDGSVEVIRLLAMAGRATVADARVAREELCGSLAKAERRAATAEFDRILARLTDACLAWPEPESELKPKSRAKSEHGPLIRVHDTALQFLPDPGAEWGVFDMLAPLPRTTGRLPVESVDAEAQAAATVALEQAERLLRHVAAAPVPLLKAGGVGAREVKRLVRDCGLDEPSVRLWLHVAEQAGLVGCQDGKVWATPLYDQWTSAEPGQRYAVLFEAWLALPTSVLGPFAPVAGAGRTPAALSESAFDGVGHHVRAAALEMMAACGAGAVADAGSLAESLRWSLPVLLEPQDDDAECYCGECAPLSFGDHPGETDAASAAVATVLAESTVLGAVALGAAAPVVRAIFGGASDLPAAVTGIQTALSAALPPTTESVRLQGDMTVVAAGLPSARLAAFFDAAAERESAGAATVWRVTDSSVRRWLDSGRSAQDLLAGLAEFCEDEPPQALSYLIEDAARRHGLVDVIAARAVIVAADEKLAAELALLPALAKFGARRLTDTVLVLDAPQQEVLGVLRFAGYLPSAHDADGSPTIAAVARPRAEVEFGRSL